jgi:hypothetical protein
MVISANKDSMFMRFVTSAGTESSVQIFDMEELNGGFPTIPAHAGSSSVDSTSRQRGSTGRICHLQTGRFR